MLKLPKIVITNIDEDPAIRRMRKRKKQLEFGGKHFIINIIIITICAHPTRTYRADLHIPLWLLLLLADIK